MSDTLKKIIILLGFVLIILVIILLINYYSAKNVATRRVDEINNLEQSYSDYIMPMNRRELMDQYKGKLSSETIYTLLYQFAIDTVPDYFKKMNIMTDTQIDEYYEENSDVIYIKLGMSNEESFKTFVKKLQSLNGDKLVFDSYSILEGSVQKEDGLLSAKLSIQYEDNDVVEFNIYVEKQINKERTSITFE